MNGQSSARQDTPRYLWIVLLVLLGQALFLTFRLADQSMWTDEMHTAYLTHLRTPAEALDQIRHIERRPPLQFMSIWFWAQVAGCSDFSLRYFSVMCTLVTTTLAFKLGKRVVSENVGLWASLLTATAPTLLLYGRMTRGYAMTMSLGLASALTFWNAWHHKRPADWVAYLLCTTFLLTSDYPALAIAAAHGLFVLVRWKEAFHHWRRLLLPAFGMCVILAVFWVILDWQASPGHFAGYSEPLGFIPDFQLSHYIRLLPTIFAGGIYVLYSFAFGETIFPWNPAVWAGGAAVAVWGWRALRQLRGRTDPNVTFILTIFLTPLALFCCIVCGLIVGQSQIVITAARGLFIAPFFYLALALGGNAISSNSVRVCTVVALLSARVLSTLSLFADPGAVLNPVYAVPVRELAVQVARNVRPGDAVIFEERLPFDIYFRQLDATTPLFTPGPQHMGHTLGAEIPPGSPAFLSQGEPFIPAIAPDRLLTYLQESQPSRLWLVVFQHEWTERTIEHEIGQPLVQAQLYQLVSRMGYAPQDSLYARLRAWWRPRTPIRYKAEILLYLRADSRGKSLQPIR